MPVEPIGSARKVSVRPFVLKWAENTPEELLWGRMSVFSEAVKGLDISLAIEGDKPESTGNVDTADTSHTGN
jgi:hypothetical protein